MNEAREPSTPAEWQQVVNLAFAARTVADCKMYGLLAGGPSIDVGRCDDILGRGRARGVYPSEPAVDLAVAFVDAFNSNVQPNDCAIINPCR